MRKPRTITEAVRRVEKELLVTMDESKRRVLMTAIDLLTKGKVA